MPASKYDIYCEQGADLILSVTVSNADGTPVNLTGGIGRMMARPSIGSSVVIASLDSNALGGINLGGATGVITVHVPASATAAYAPTKTGVYDLEFTDAASVVSRVIEGKFTVTPQVTR